MLSNKNTTDFICSVCGDQFQNENQFYGHLQIHSGEVVWNCSQCDNPNVSFGSQSKLIAHENLHHNLVRPFKCQKCELVFERASQLDYHRRSFHLGEKSQVCQICGKAFFRKTDLKTHLNVHLGTNLLICELCGRKFNHVSNLIRHCRSHAGMKPYPCCICGKRFTQLSSLTRHKRIHGNDEDNPDNKKKKVIRRRHYCKTCGESFQFIFLLRQHEQLHVKEINSFECKNCHQIFHSQENLSDHQCKTQLATRKCDIKIIDNNDKSTTGEKEKDKLPKLMEQRSSQIEFDNDEESPIFRELGEKLNVIGIETNRDESINISDILSPYNCDEIELPNNLAIQSDRENNVEEILSGVDFSLMTDSRPKKLMNSETLKDQRSKCLHIEGSQLYIEVCESDYLKTLGLHALEFGEDADFFSETDHIAESTDENSENCEPTLRLVQTDAGQQFYELEINPLHLGEDQDDMLNYNSQNSSLLVTPESDGINQIEEPSMNSDMNFIDDIATDMMNHTSNSERIEHNEEIPDFNNHNEIETPMVRLVQNEEGEQFFELVRDSSDYQQVCRSIDNISGDNLLEKALENIVDNSRMNDSEQQNSKEASFRKKPKTSRSNPKSQSQKFECIVCNKRFSTVSNLKQHTGTHFSDQQKFQCKECGMSFAWKSTLNKHMASTHRPDGPQKFVCEICPKVYSTLSQVNEHVKRDHLKERNHVCTECGKSFFKKFDLKSHIRTHTNERPYVCPACGKSFHHQSHIIRHERIHSGEKPYSCNICNKSFTQPGSLKIHKQRHQDVEKVHILDYRIDEDDPMALSTL